MHIFNPDDTVAALGSRYLAIVGGRGTR